MVPNDQEQPSSDTQDRLRAALSNVHDAIADCPIEHPHLQRFKYRKRRPDCDYCPKCGATARQNCGPQVSTAFALVVAVEAVFAGGGAQQSPHSLQPPPIRPKESPPPTRPEEPTIHMENDHAL